MYKKQYQKLHDLALNLTGNDPVLKRYPYLYEEPEPCAMCGMLPDNKDTENLECIYNTELCVECDRIEFDKQAMQTIKEWEESRGV